MASQERLIAIVRSNDSSVAVSNVVRGTIAALFTTASRRPNLRIASAGGEAGSKIDRFSEIGRAHV